MFTWKDYFEKDSANDAEDEVDSINNKSNVHPLPRIASISDRSIDLSCRGTEFHGISEELCVCALKATSRRETLACCPCYLRQNSSRLTDGIEPVTGVVNGLRRAVDR